MASESKEERCLGAFPSLTKALCQLAESLSSRLLVILCKLSPVLELKILTFCFKIHSMMFLNMLNTSIMHVFDKVEDKVKIRSALF